MITIHDSYLIDYINSGTISYKSRRFHLFFIMIVYISVLATFLRI